MGYTHYFEQRRDFTDTEWDALTFYANELFRVSPTPLGDRHGALSSSPEVTKEFISFNGREPDDYETLRIERTGSGFNFTKTGFGEIRAYDFMVKAVLILAYNIAPTALDISSDGFDFEWEDSLAFVGEHLGNSLALPPRVAINDGFIEEYRTGPKYEEEKAAYLGR